MKSQKQNKETDIGKSPVLIAIWGLPPASTSCRRGRVTMYHEQLHSGKTKRNNGTELELLLPPIGPSPDPVLAFVRSLQHHRCRGYDTAKGVDLRGRLPKQETRLRVHVRSLADDPPHPDAGGGTARVWGSAWRLSRGRRAEFASPTSFLSLRKQINHVQNRCDPYGAFLCCTCHDRRLARANTRPKDTRLKLNT